MKKSLSLIVFFISLIVSIMAQPPQRMTYQAIIRNSNNELVANQQIGIRVSILQDNINGGAVFMEKHTVTTNAYGLATIQIGTGTPLLVNTLAGIEWGKHNFFVKTEVDITGGTNYTIVGTQQLLTVPYSFYSESAHKVDTALYAAAAGSATTSITASFANTAHTAIYADTADYSAQSNYSANAYNSIYADTAKFLLNAQNSDTAKFAYNSDTANYAAAASYADTADYTLNSNHAIYADTADYVLNSNHAIYADTADFNNLLNKPAGTNKGDILYWDTLDMAWHIVPAGNPGEVLTMDTNSVPYWNASATPVVTLPTVTTDSVSNINASSATVFATVTNDGGTPLVFSGVCWDTTINPTLSNSHTLNGLGMGSYTCLISGLSYGIKYYVRAFAMNNAGTVYGDTIGIRTIAYAPTVNTALASSVNSKSAVVGGNVISDGGSTVTEYGICWNTNGNPTLSDSTIVLGSGIGAFNYNMTGLNALTKYYFCAYAINAVDTSYGSVEEFTTLWACGGTITDYDNNNYNTLEIGTQCWMKENLKTEHYANGDPISPGNSVSTTTAYWYYPNNNPSNKATFGLLYNWPAAMKNAASSSANPSGVQGACPNGWHIPSVSEWTQLINYVSSDIQYWCGSESTYIAKSIASVSGWTSTSTTTCAISNDVSANDLVGLSIVPAGGYNGNYFDFGLEAEIWSSTENSSGSAHGYNLKHYNAYVIKSTYGVYNAYAVRCLKD